MARYGFVSRGQAPELRCLLHALMYPPVVARALTVALVVGTILAAINHADVILAGQITPGLVLQIVLTYAVPFSVSIYSAMAASRLPAR